MNTRSLSLAAALALCAAPCTPLRAEGVPSAPSLEDIQKQISEKTAEIKKLQAAMDKQALENEAVEIRAKALQLAPHIWEELVRDTGKEHDWENRYEGTARYSGSRTTAWVHQIRKVSLSAQGEGAFAMRDINSRLVSCRSEVDSIKTNLRNSEIEKAKAEIFGIASDVDWATSQIMKYQRQLAETREQLKRFKTQKEALILCGVKDEPPVEGRDYKVVSEKVPAGTDLGSRTM